MSSESPLSKEWRTFTDRPVNEVRLQVKEALPHILRHKGMTMTGFSFEVFGCGGKLSSFLNRNQPISEKNVDKLVSAVDAIWPAVVEAPKVAAE